LRQAQREGFALDGACKEAGGFVAVRGMFGPAPKWD
jgi:hypothetical protein